MQISNPSATTALAVAMKEVLGLTSHNVGGYEWEDNCQYDPDTGYTRDVNAEVCPHTSVDDVAVSRDAVLKILLRLGEKK